MNTASRAINTASSAPSRAAAWTAFWADPTQSRCAAGAPEIWRALSEHWSSFSRSLAHGTRVLDLGCGAGIVGRLLIGARPDLHVTGIDAATVPEASHPQIELVSRVAMESLPFAAQSFGAVVSQFGYEYSQTAQTAREIARVLAPGAMLSFVVHHAESTIVLATRARLNAIRAFLAPPLRATATSGDVVACKAQIATLLARFPDDMLIAELARAVTSRLGGPRTNWPAIWTIFEEALAPERRVAESLDESCVAQTQIDEWLAPLRDACELLPAAVLREANGDPVGWTIAGGGRRAAV